MITKGAVRERPSPKYRIDSEGRGVRMQPISAEDVRRIEEQNMEFSRQGLRVLGIAYKKFDEERTISTEGEKDFIFLGLIAMMDPPRIESKAAVGCQCIEAGIRRVMVAGDHKVTAFGNGETYLVL